MAERVRFGIDPNDECPGNYTGSIRATLTDGRVIDDMRPHPRGGSCEPFGRAQLQRKCLANPAVEGAGPELAGVLAAFAEGLGASTVVVPGHV